MLEETFGAESPDDTSKGDKRNVVSRVILNGQCSLR